MLTTHHPEEASALADRVIVMSQGTVAAMGTPEQIKQLVGARHLEEAVMHLTNHPAGALAGQSINQSMNKAGGSQP